MSKSFAMRCRVNVFKPKVINVKNADSGMFLTKGDATPSADDINFNFGGRVSTCPTTKSLPLCRAFGHTWYVEALL